MGKHVLVVDDHPPMVRLVEDALVRKGYAVDSAADGAECLKKLESSPPDLLILDMAMPVMDGLEALRTLRQADGTRKLPVIVLTARKDPRDELDGWMSGADVYLTKPCDMEDLIEAVEHLLARASG